MDDETKRALAQILAEIQALKLLMNEAFAVTLSREISPDESTSLARLDLEKIISETEKKAASTSGISEYQKLQFEQIRAAVKAQLDAIEKRVSRLKIDRTTH